MAVDRADLGEEEEDESDIAEAPEEAESTAGVALLNAAIAEVDEIQPKTLDISAEWLTTRQPFPGFQDATFNHVIQLLNVTSCGDQEKNNKLFLRTRSVLFKLFIF